jgi:hypothetical protein
MHAPVNQTELHIDKKLSKHKSTQEEEEMRKKMTKTRGTSSTSSSTREGCLMIKPSPFFS